MQNQNHSQLFAFKLAEKQAKETRQEPTWKVRDGVSVAGCTGEDMRASDQWRGYDAGIWC